jgi:hypothetical protein
MTRSQQLVATSARLFVAAGAAICTAALGVNALAASSVRSQLDLQLNEPPGEPGAALEVLGTNARLASAVLAGALAAQRFPSARTALDLTLGTLAILNVAVLAAALGAYGAALVGRVAIHTALEIAAFAIAGGSYLAARNQHLTASVLLLATALASALLLTAALAETHLELGGGP